MADPKILALSSRVGLTASNNGGEKCVTCEGGGDGRMLHRVKHQGALRQLCSSCILFYNRGVYCSVCYQVYRNASDLGDPALWITCCKCLRLSHVECMRKRSSSADHLSSVCIDCSHLNALGEASTSQTPLSENLNVEALSIQTEFSSVASPEALDPGNKKLRSSYTAACKLKQLGVDSEHVSSLFDHNTLAAAKVVASLAAKEATDAKARAVAKAGVAAKAATRAKVALDAAYRAGRDEMKFAAEAARQPSMNTVEGKVLEGRKHEKVDPPVERNDQAGQMDKMANPIQQRRTSSAATIPAAETTTVQGNPVPSKHHETVLQGSCDETKLSDPFSLVNDVADKSHEELGQQVIALASSEGLLSGNPHFKFLQGPLLLSTNESCSSVSRGQRVISNSLDNTGTNRLQTNNAVEFEGMSCSATASDQCNDQEVKDRTLISAQTKSRHLGQIEIVLPGVESVDRPESDRMGVENICNKGIATTDIDSNVVSSAMHVVNNVYHDRDEASISQTSQLGEDGNPAQLHSLHANLGIF